METTKDVPVTPVSEKSTPVTTTSSTTPATKKSKTGLIIAIIVGVLLVICICCGVLFGLPFLTTLGLAANPKILQSTDYTPAAVPSSATTPVGAGNKTTKTETLTDAGLTVTLPISWTVKNDSYVIDTSVGMEENLKNTSRTTVKMPLYTMDLEGKWAVSISAAGDLQGNPGIDETTPGTLDLTINGKAITCDTSTYISEDLVDMTCYNLPSGAASEVKNLDITVMGVTKASLQPGGEVRTIIESLK